MVRRLPIMLFSALLWLGGCAPHPSPAGANTASNSGAPTASSEIAAFETARAQTPPPPMVLPPVYRDLSVFSGQSITFSAENASLSKVLYTISQSSGLNLIIDADVPTQTPITLSLTEAPLEDALDVVMELSGCYYTLRGNILHVKQFMQRNFHVPYVHTTTSFNSDLGGNMLGSTQSDEGGGSGDDAISGTFALKYENPAEMNDFYAQLEANVGQLLSDDGRYSLNRFSGTLSVYDRKANVDAVETLIGEIERKVNRQVLIEAKILEVILNDGHQLGVSWESVANSLINNDQLVLQQTLGLPGTVAGTMKYSTKNFSAILQALDSSGNVDTLSNPRIKVLSGQSALISSGKLVPFWEKEITYTAVASGTTTGTAVPEVTYNRRDVLDGVSMGVTPTVLENGKIMLNLIPITSSIEDVVDYEDENGNPVASAPLLNVKEAGTVIYAEDNDLVLIGGLIDNTISSTEERVPFLGDIPGLGALFTRTVKNEEKRELVILLKLNVMEH